MGWDATSQPHPRRGRFETPLPLFSAVTDGMTPAYACLLLTTPYPYAACLPASSSSLPCRRKKSSFLPSLHGILLLPYLFSLLLFLSPALCSNATCLLSPLPLLLFSSLSPNEVTGDSETVVLCPRQVTLWYSLL